VRKPGRRGRSLFDAVDPCWNILDEGYETFGALGTRSDSGHPIILTNLSSQSPWGPLFSPWNTILCGRSLTGGRFGGACAFWIACDGNFERPRRSEDEEDGEEDGEDDGEVLWSSQSFMWRVRLLDFRS
jgi:hypothetical protein